MRSALCIIFLLVSLFSLGGKRPATIDEAILYFEKKWSDKQKEDFKNTPEKEAVTEMHFSVGIWIRNEWIRSKKDTALVNQFYRLGIDHENDMSTIILTSLHRKLNNEPINLEGQVAYFKEYWKPIKACVEKITKKAEENYNKLSVGDSITIYMDVDAKFGTRNAILHECPETEWSFDYKNDLMVKGIVTSKYLKPDQTDMFIKVKISFLNSDNTTILFKPVKRNEEVEFGLRYLLIK